MSNPLDDRLKNEYSTQYILVIGENSFYPDAASINQDENDEKISESAVVGLDYEIGGSSPPTKVDPFRQAAGKLWSFKNNAVRFYDNYANIGNSSKHIAISNKYKEEVQDIGYYSFASTAVAAYEDVSDQWGEFFATEVYPGSISLKRKATRLKLRFPSDDLLQNRLSMLSLITDIQKKNQIKAYQNLDTGYDPDGISTSDSDILEDLEIAIDEANEKKDSLKVDLLDTKYTVSQVKSFPSGWSGESLEDKLQDYQALYKANIGNNYDEEALYYSDVAENIRIYSIDNGNTVKDNLSKQEGAQNLNPDVLFPTSISLVKTLVTELIESYNSHPDGFAKKGSFSIFNWTNWIYNSKIEALKRVIGIESENENLASLNLELENKEKSIEQKQDLQESRAESAYITFQPANSNYNYDALVKKENLDLNTSGILYSYGSYGDLPDDDPIKYSFTNDWEFFTLNALGRAVKNGQLDSFYDPIASSYSNDQRLMYKDAPFMMQLPMSPRAMQLANTPNKNELFVDIKSSYNYYSEFYENGTKQDEYVNSSGQEVPFSELEMPLIYEVPLDEDGTASSYVDKSKTYSIKYNFDKFGHKLLNCGYEDDSQSDKNLNIILDQNSKQLLDSYDGVKTQFPFYVNFEFKSDANKDFATLFNNTGMTNQLIKTWISNFFYSEQYAKNPDKQDPITKFGEQQIGTTGVNSYGYYDPFDPDPAYSGKFENSFRAGICKEEIYKIETTKDFYKIIPPETPADIGLLGDQLVRETTPDYGVREFDLNKWLDGYIKAIAGEGGKSAGNIPYASWVQQVMGDETGNSSAFFSKTFSDSEEFFTSGDDLEKTLKAVIFLGKYRQLVDQKSRNYYDIMNKDLAYSEALFYRIQKAAAVGATDTQDGPLVQNFWLIKPNDKENEVNSDIMRYIDTQVKYDQNYEYTVYAYQLVVGTKYGFQFANQPDTEFVNENFQNYSKLVRQSAQAEGFQSKGLPEPIYKGGAKGQNLLFPSANNQSDDRLAIFDVVCEPDVKLVEMPFYKKKVVISDAASTAPEVDIIPLRGRDNEIKINFYPSSVDRELVPVSVDFKDLLIYDKIRKNQDRFLLKMTPPNIAGTVFQIIAQGYDPLEIFGLYPLAHVEPKLLFKSDDFATQYQIYRMGEAPNNYAEFKDSLFVTINAQELSSFTDKIEQNKKYYYVFRSIDVHGNPSYPSPMYQVEMVENSGAVYPVISIYEPQLPSAGLKSKPFRRYLKVDAAAMQGILDLKGSELDDADTAITNKPIKLGEKDTKLFSAPDSRSHKKFKFRVRSRHTGKIADLNVSFKIRKLEPEAVLSCGEVITSKKASEALE